MRFQPSSQKQNRGFALIMVMLVIITLGVMAGTFATSMKVEMKLARNAGFDSEMEWLGRSGVELSRYVLALQMGLATEPYDSLNQKWAGGPLGTNDLLAAVSLENNELPRGSGKMFSVKIVDLERKYNINAAAMAAIRGDQSALNQALTLMGVDAGEFSGTIGSIMDWVDPDNDPHIGGTESDYYEGLEPAYVAKNGLIDDITELRLIRGVTPQMYWGPNVPASEVQNMQLVSPSLRLTRQVEIVSYPVGLVDLFTPVSGRLVNINTASAYVLQLVPGMDENVAQSIIQWRSGPDGVDGNEDDMPFRNVGELRNVVSLNPQSANALTRYFTVRSATFEVTVTTTIDQRKVDWVALIRRDSPRDVKVLSFHRK